MNEQNNISGLSSLKKMTGASVVALLFTANAAIADAPADGVSGIDEIVVTARRKNEVLQDVPLVVNAVTAENLSKLNIRQFEDITTVVPGLTLHSNANGIGTTSSLRGVNYDVNASGNNGTIEYYLNDAPLSSNIVFQSMFDVGQIEVLRGPQGTLRGRSTPSGSITVTTHKPDLDEFGGYMSATATDIGGTNFNGALNIPILKDKLAIRVAGVLDDNELDRVRSTNNPGFDPYSKTNALRLSARFAPIDSLEFNAYYTRLTNNLAGNDQRESLTAINPAAPVSPVTISADDRLGLQDVPRRNHQFFEVYNWQGEWRFAGQKLNYVGSVSDAEFLSFAPGDGGDFFNAAYPALFQGYGQPTLTSSQQKTHEVRLSSDQRLFGFLDYTVGGLSSRLEAPADLTSQTPFFAIAAPRIPTPADGAPTVCLTPTTCSGLINTPIARRGHTLERSVFGNLTVHLGSAAELSGGLRYIRYTNEATLAINNVIQRDATEDDKLHAVIYAGTFKYNFTEDFMAYASVGSSWRPGAVGTGDFSLVRSPLENTFLKLGPEKSRSYELGFKSTWLEKRLKLNVSAYHQEYTNYPYRAPGAGVFFISTDTGRAPGTTTQSVKSFNFIAAVPVDVDGVELETALQATRHWNVGLTASYALGKIKNGKIPCNDYNPRNGVPDSEGTIPTLAAVRAVTGAENLSSCIVDYRSSFAPLFNASVTSEYTFPIGSVDGFGRGLLSYYADSQNDPTNPVDDVKSYALLNLFLGIRQPGGAWEASIYGKNVADTNRVLTRGATPLTTSYATALGGQTGTTTYRGITFTAPREFGINVRYSFGSH